MTMANGCTCFDFNYSILAEIAEDAIVICEHDRICFVNSNTVMLSGWTEDELLGMDIDFLLPEFHRRQVRHSQLKARHKHENDWLATVSAKKVPNQSREFTVLSLRDLAKNVEHRKEHAELVVQLTGSLATELIDLLSALLINGQAGLEWLSSSPPNLPRATQTMESLVRNSKEAAEMVTRLRTLIAVPHSSKLASASAHGGPPNYNGNGDHVAPWEDRNTMVKLRTEDA
jgi:PAS domain S-box-containing protein